MPLRSDFIRKHLKLILCLLFLFTLAMLIYHAYEPWKVQLEATVALNEGTFLIRVNLKVNTILLYAT